MYIYICISHLRPLDTDFIPSDKDLENMNTISSIEGYWLTDSPYVDY